MTTNNAINSSNPFIQIVSSSLGTEKNITTVIPADNTIPQNTEGDEVLTVSITPKFSTSILEITFSGWCAKGTAGFYTVALFQDTTASALAAKCFQLSAAQSSSCLLEHVMTSGTTSSTTFKIRIGPAANNADVNGNSAGSQLMGGVASTILTVIEKL